MLTRPRDIVLDLGGLRRLERDKDVEGALRNVLGQTYRASMRASPITGRMARMKSEVKRGEETFERKARYLFWLN